STGRADARTTNRGFERSRWRRRLPRGFGERIRSGWRKAREPRIARRWAGRAGPGTRTGFACTSIAERCVGKAATASRWLLSTQIGLKSGNPLLQLQLRYALVDRKWLGLIPGACCCRVALIGLSALSHSTDMNPT